MKQIILNGENHGTNAINFHELIKELSLEPGSLVIGHNGTIIRKELWDSVEVTDGDTVELIALVAGG